MTARVPLALAFPWIPADRSHVAPCVCGRVERFMALAPKTHIQPVASDLAGPANASAIRRRDHCRTTVALKAYESKRTSQLSIQHLAKSRHDERNT